jgi:diadenosine tetraphosphate (Ap4A) HIT family hydrolase
MRESGVLVGLATSVAVLLGSIEGLLTDCSVNPSERAPTLTAGRSMTTRWRLFDGTGTIASMADEPCIFCAIADGRAEASVVHQDDHVVAFMDLNPISPGHVLVIPRQHAAGLDDVDEETGLRIWRTGHRLARALRRSSLRCEGINVFVADGEVAFQEVFHFHLHVIPRRTGDGFTLHVETEERPRRLLDEDAGTLKDALAGVTAGAGVNPPSQQTEDPPATPPRQATGARTAASPPSASGTTR